MLALAFLFAAAVFSAAAGFSSRYAGAENTDFAGGDGSEGAPFLIAEAEHLDNLRKYAYNKAVYTGPGTFEGYYFKLTADIDLSGYIEDRYSGGGWEPIADADEGWAFRGNIDGGGHTVSGLWIDGGGYYAGLFNEIFGSSVRGVNIVLGDKGVTGTECVGGLAAHLDACEVTRCRVEGNVSLNGSGWGFFPNACGGIAGAAENSSFSECEFTGVLSNKNPFDDTDVLGGIAGSVYDGEILNCRAIVGIDPDENEGLSSKFAGGIIGTGLYGITAENCYAAVTSEKPAAPVIAGKEEGLGNSMNFIARSNYYNAGMNVNPDAVSSANITGLSDADMKKAASYIGWDFENVWDIDEGKSAPELRCFLSEPYPKQQPQQQPADPPPSVFTPDNSTPTKPEPLGPWGIAAVTAGGAVVLAGVSAALWFGVRKRRVETIIETQTVEIPVEVIKEVPIIKKPLPADLSGRERRVAGLVLNGKSRREIADALNISEGAVRTYSARIYTKAGVDGQKEFIARYL